MLDAWDGDVGVRWRVVLSENILVGGCIVLDVRCMVIFERGIWMYYRSWLKLV